MIINKVAVLGRGESLQKFAKFSDLFDTIYMIGTFHKEIKKIGLKHFKNKKIIHLVGRSDWGWKNNVDKDLNIIRVQTMYYPYQLKRKKGKKGILEKFKNFKIGFLPDYMKNRGFPHVDRPILEKYSKEYDNYEELCSFLENTFKDNIEMNIKNVKRHRYWPTTGIFALDLCLIENMPEKIYLFGIDAMKTFSFIRYNWEPNYIRANGKGAITSKLMIYYIKVLLKEFYLTKFYSASHKIKIKSSNWVLI